MADLQTEIACARYAAVRGVRCILLQDCLSVCWMSPLSVDGPLDFPCVLDGPRAGLRGTRHLRSPQVVVGTCRIIKSVMATQIELSSSGCFGDVV